jgi:hypothetical protein
MRSTLVGTALAAVVATLSIPGCAVDATRAAEPVTKAQAAGADAPIAAEAGTVLATLASGGHTFVFGRSVRGDIVVSESAPAKEAPILRDGAAGRSATDVYRALSGGAEPPDELFRAASAASFRVVPSAPRAPEVAPRAAKSEDVIVFPFPLYTAGQLSFQSTYCSLEYMSDCDLGSGDINDSLGQSIWASNYFAYGMEDATSTGTAAVVGFYWTGSAWNLDWISPTMYPGNTVYEYWWSSSPIRRASELAGKGAGALAQGGITPGNLVVTNLEAQEFNFNVGGAPFSTQFPNDSEVTCYVSGIKITTIDTSLVGINVNVGAVCTNQGEEDTQLQGAYCQGKTTGQVASTTVYAPYFVGGYCCKSMGGNNTSC